MKCSKHEGQDACGVCVTCGRAMCSDCVATVGECQMVCGARCESLIRRQMTVENATIEILQLTAHQYKGGKLALKLAGGACILAAVGELLNAFVLPQFIPRIRSTHPLHAFGFAGLLVVFAAIFLIGARSLTPKSEKYDQALNELE